MDTVFIRNLEIQAIVGIYDFERTNEQAVIVNIDMHTDIQSAAKSCDINQALNYKEVADKVSALVIEKKYLLVETMAEDIASMVLADFTARSVTVEVGKPQAIANAESVGVKITRGA